MVNVPVNVSSNALNFFEVLLIIILGGGFGGFASSIFDNFDTQSAQKPIEHGCIKCNNAYFFRRALIGIAGAFCVSFLGFWMGKLSLEATTGNLLFLSCFCVAAGTIGFTILPQLRRKLAEQIINEKIDKVSEKVDSAITVTNENMEYTKAMLDAETALNTKQKVDIDSAIVNLKLIRNKFKRDRSLNIYLGRLLRANKEYNEAIITLRAFIEEIDNNTNKFNKAHDSIDKADAYYNIACYHALKAQNTIDNPMEHDRLINEAYDAFKNSVELSNGLLLYAKNDNDLKWLFEEEDKFKEFKD